MTYSGTVKNGVVVLDSSPGLKDGDRVSVQPKGEEKPRPGDPAALLTADVKWVGDPAEVDELLSQVQRMRDEDIELQRGRGE